MELAKAISHLGPDHEAIDLYHQAENLFQKPGDVDYTMLSICMQRVAALQGKNESREELAEELQIPKDNVLDGNSVPG
ncbi:hypothetical protein COCSUDRAFT_58222 [Coccomyxa subellipsoidea C-169]|uniref:Tetratricopeptide repeat protein n=1 Tax=Coccomyxa subellipsoidea (strain C-169) TaxID=574566 RepID=I0YNL9_COCSC|nr:hypothetical protein COCSUDRAFT_58222 [Coccomyxa subellipsoidea C-169]EIE19988.1 hypothetical protein COCSUDRAFT_58222 [Coccomyxa subellipsoidea C-169]|eukprot:XP_005644532.1 hypothetical protein COCSUDRAFT_58222 [Coccomyxa subellipsoidea C-169]